MLKLLALILAAGIAAGCAGSGTAGVNSSPHVDWTRFGFDASRSSDDPNATGITAANVGSLLYIYDPHGSLRVYDAESGRQLAELPCGGGHWNSPIAIDGRIALPEGDANRHRTSGVLNIWRLPR